MVIRIDFEGCDGSGKTTMMAFFVSALRERGYRVLETREVGAPHIPLCVALRGVILDPEFKNLDGKTMELVFSAMRNENEEYYASVADEYDYIVSDRGWLSHLAYSDMNCSEQFTEELYGGVMAKYTPKPDIVIMLEIDQGIARARREARGGVLDNIELKGVLFQMGVGLRFEHHCKSDANAGKVHYVNASGNIPATQHQVLEILNKITGNS